MQCPLCDELQATTAFGRSLLDTDVCCTQVMLTTEGASAIVIVRLQRGRKGKDSQLPAGTETSCQRISCRRCASTMVLWLHQSPFQPRLAHTRLCTARVDGVSFSAIPGRSVPCGCALECTKACTAGCLAVLSLACLCTLDPFICLIWLPAKNSKPATCLHQAVSERLYT